jgi:hypothetical protein
MRTLSRRLRLVACFALIVLCVSVAVYAALAAVARPREHSADFYLGVRYLVFLWGAYATIVFSLMRRGMWPVYIGSAALFNPFKPFFLSKAVWSVVDLSIALLAIWTLSVVWKDVRTTAAMKQG